MCTHGGYAPARGIKGEQCIVPDEEKPLELCWECGLVVRLSGCEKEVLSCVRRIVTVVVTPPLLPPPPLLARAAAPLARIGGRTGNLADCVGAS